MSRMIYNEELYLGRISKFSFDLHYEQPYMYPERNDQIMSVPNRTRSALTASTV